MRRRGAALGVLCLLAAAMSGCELFDLFDKATNPPPPTYKIGENRTILVLASAPDTVMAKFPTVEREMDAAVIANLTPQLSTAKFVPVDKLLDWQAKNPDWVSLSASAIGKQLKAGIVIELNVIKFQTKERADSFLYQGLVTCQPIVKDVEDSAGEAILWRPGAIQVRWPKTPTETRHDISESTVQGQLLSIFGQTFAEEFGKRFEED